ncbi:hypothetical protein M5D96_010554 [Drosophila gunungcola]|uniref:Uncharacterized protein n=1 Tax=Drosophila gunungcola TaxID=103775 RepID=A0A9P9YGX0_9MUSC|nr:hypothetical protein M5D96_010554 [Drosophila gunungcola]
MVLTNFECWAHGDPSAAATFETEMLRPSMDPFNPRAVTFMTDANNNNNNNNNHIEPGQAMPEVLPLEVMRCKKRLNPGQNPVEDADVDQPMYTKRCRYDEADLAAQYCNESAEHRLPPSQISRKSIDPLKNIKSKPIGSEAEADLYIATHGGCLHHFRKLSGSELEEFDI